MADIALSQITVSLVTPPTGKSRTSPPPSVTQSAPISPDEAHQMASFSFGEPTYLPAGFSLVDAAHLSGDVELVVLSYQGPSGRLMAILAPLAQYEAGTDGVRRYFVVADDLQEATVGMGTAAVGIKGGNPSTMPPALNLVWENGQLLGHLLGQGLTIDELERTAASIP